MDKEKEESARRTIESFLEKSEIEKAFILGYMVKRIQLKELETGLVEEPELVVESERG
ncbi:MAG: hypothetical protein HFH74_15445 [Lachnospiraceae bacterium]|nr:hypothetical protein [Lachnospiraceae bacterium]